LHIALGYINTTGGDSTPVYIFDGQHKTAAQLLLNTKMIPVRIFLNPDKDRLVITNFNAGTTLRQVAFDKSVQRHLGNTIYRERVHRYQNDHGLDTDNLDFSEQNLVSYFKGESIRKYILDAIRDGILYDPENRLTMYIDTGGKGKEKPLSYSTVDKTFFSFFINQKILSTNISAGLENGTNPRILAKQQIVQLMSIIAEELLVDHYDFTIGTNQIESRIAKGEDLPHGHIRAYRMCREEILYNWLSYVNQIVYTYYAVTGSAIGNDNRGELFENEFPPVLWGRIRNYVRNLANMSLWVNLSLASTVFGGKQVNAFWSTVFKTGNTPSGTPVLQSPLDLTSLIQN
jgi:hypothetical protein